MRPLAAALLAGAVAFAGCSSGPADAIAETQEKLGEIRSGNLKIEFLANAEGDLGEGRAGFSLTGPFALPDEEGELPQAQLLYEPVPATAAESLAFIATGDRAFVEVEGVAYEMPPEQSASLQGSGAESEGIFEELEIDDWVVDPEVTATGETERITGRLDVVEAFDDLIGAARSLGAPGLEALPELGERDAEQLRRAVESARLEMVTGAEDRLLRSLRIDVDFGLDASEGLPQAIGDLVGAGLTFTLEIDDPNSEVSVQPPANPRPLSELAPVG